MFAVVFASGAFAQTKAPEPPGKGKSGAPYEKDPGKYTEEPTKNMGKGGSPGGGGDTLDDAGLKRVLAKLPPGTRQATEEAATAAAKAPR